MNLSDKLIIFAGPTGVGKTEIGIEFAKTVNAEIISADSVQIYKELNVGTAKPSPEELSAVPHHLIDLWSPFEDFNLAKFIELADETIAKIRGRSKNCVVVGGTGMYIEGLVKGIFSETSKDLKIREMLLERLETEGSEILHEELKAVDPEIAAKISKADGVRITRALEVFLVSGKTMSELQNQSRMKGDKYKHILFILTRERGELYERINKRVDIMFQNGFADEVKSLLAKGLNSDYQCMKAVGYREIAEALMKNEDPETTKENIKKSSRNYAKRQLTWFRNRLPGKIIDLSGKTTQIILDELKNYIEINF